MLNRKNILLITIFISFIFLWLVSEILLPFIMGFLIAYILSPSLDKLKGIGIGHQFSVSILVLISLIFFLGTFIFLIPLFIQQFDLFFEKFPGIIDKNFIWLIEKLTSVIPVNIVESNYKDFLYNIVSNQGEKIILTSVGFIKSILQSGLAILNIIGLIVITPVVAWYLLNDWGKIKNYIEKLIPSKEKKRFYEVIDNTDKIISSFFRGQLTVSCLIAFYYLIALLIIGVEGAFAAAFSIGVLSFIPYLGTFIGLLIVLSLTAIQFASINIILIVFMIFILGQFIESYYLTPKYIGKNVGLHPVIIIFSLLVGGNIFGLLGVLLAVPFTAILLSLIPKSKTQIQK